MPDLYGWSKKNVETFAKWLNLEVEFEVHGETVKKQSVRSNTALKDLQKIKNNIRRLECLFLSLLE